MAGMGTVVATRGQEARPDCPSEPRVVWDFWPLELPEDVSGSEPPGPPGSVAAAPGHSPRASKGCSLAWGGGGGEVRHEPGHCWGHGDGRQGPFPPSAGPTGAWGSPPLQEGWL